jgi:hypothetical protein
VPGAVRRSVAARLTTRSSAQASKSVATERDRMSVVGLIVHSVCWIVGIAVAAADRQDAWSNAGDPRGIYGEFPAAS